MDLPDLVGLLRCPDCGGGLRLETAELRCPGCGRSYPVVGGVPVMAGPATEEEVWGERYFRALVESKGDAEPANGYFNDRSFRNVRDGLLALLDRPVGLNILDIGCGTGHLSRALAPDNRLVGADISLEMALFARAKGLAAVRTSAEKLAFADASFDLAMSNNLVQSFADGAPFVREAARVLRPGGRFILTAANGRNLAMALFRRLEKRKYSHLWAYSADSLRRLILDAGLDVKSLIFFDFWTGGVSTVPGDAGVKWSRNRLAASVAVDAVKPR